MRVLITGSRYWDDIKMVEDELDKLHSTHPDMTVVHGAARGADAIAASWAAKTGVTVEAHPADWNTYGRSAGPRRNAEMVALGADLCLAFPLGQSRGTRGCMKMAAAVGIPVREIMKPR